MTPTKVLIGGIGNIFFGDDAFGVVVARELAGRNLPTNVRVVDFGIRGLDLGYALLEELELIILVDVVQRGGPPGTLYVLEPLVNESSSGAIQSHEMAPERALEFARSMGASLKQVRIVACEPESFELAADGESELTPAVAGAVMEAIRLIEGMIHDKRLRYA